MQQVVVRRVATEASATHLDLSLHLLEEVFDSSDVGKHSVAKHVHEIHIVFRVYGEDALLKSIEHGTVLVSLLETEPQLGRTFVENRLSDPQESRNQNDSEANSDTQRDDRFDLHVLELESCCEDYHKDEQVNKDCCHGLLAVIEHDQVAE